MATKITIIPNIRLRFFPEVLFDKYAPTCVPKIIPMHRSIIYSKCTLPSVKCVAAPANEVNIMMNIEVATAKCIGKSIRKCIIGTMTTPPPMPSKPEKKPPKKLGGKPFFKSE